MFAKSVQFSPAHNFLEYAPNNLSKPILQNSPEYYIDLAFWIKNNKTLEWIQDSHASVSEHVRKKTTL